MDTNGASLKWGQEGKNAKAFGHFSVIRLDKITEIDEDLFALSNCECCPPTAFDKNGKIFVSDRKGDWNIITDSFAKASFQKLI